MNPQTREARLAVDNYECQLSELFGIARLSGKPCSEEMEVHHITYERYGSEEIEDLITVCTRCHEILTDAIRRERFSRGQPKLGEVSTGQRIIHQMEETDDDSEPELSDCGNSTVVDAQRSTSRPREYIFAEDQGDFVEAAQQDRFRLRGNGEVGMVRQPVPLQEGTVHPWLRYGGLPDR